MVDLIHPVHLARQRKVVALTEVLVDCGCGPDDLDILPSEWWTGAGVVVRARYGFTPGPPSPATLDLIREALRKREPSHAQ